MKGPCPIPGSSTLSSKSSSSQEVHEKLQVPYQVALHALTFATLTMQRLTSEVDQSTMTGQFIDCAPSSPFKSHTVWEGKENESPKFREQEVVTHSH